MISATFREIISQYEVVFFDSYGVLRDHAFIVLV